LGSGKFRFIINYLEMEEMMTAEADVQEMPCIWLHSFCPEILSVGDLGALLQNKAIQTRAFSVGGMSGPGIVVASEISTQVCDFVRTINGDMQERIVVLITEDATLANGNPWHLLLAGASEILEWNSGSDLASVLDAKFLRWREVDNLISSALVRDSLVGQSRGWRAVLRQLIEVARFTDDPIVLIGETGTGKELAARLIHTLDLRRNNRELVILDCATVVPELSGSEFFGHERGAFTGAISSHDGAFTLADGGTLFLDEIGELPMNLQIQLLRVLQEHTYKRVGSNVWRKIDFRLICATNRDLDNEQVQGQFRKDLYYRVARWVVKMPALRERVEDVIPLIRHFMRETRPDQPPPELDSKVQEYLLAREYPGNVRDLRNLVFRIMARHVGLGPITIGDIPLDERPSGSISVINQGDISIEQCVRRALASGLSLREIRKLVEDTTIAIVLGEEGGNLQRAAKVLDVTDRTLQKRRADQKRQVEAIINQ